MLANFAYRAAAAVLSPAGPKARLSILIYHRVLSAPDSIFPGEPTIERFDMQMAQLKSIFKVLPLADAVARLRTGNLPARAACITFDDGYADNAECALPVLQKHGLHATFFVATAYLNGGRMFNDSVIEAFRRSPLSRLDLDSLDLGQHDISTPGAKAHAIGQLLPRVKYLPLDIREATVQRIAELATSPALPNDLMMSTAQLKRLHAAGMAIGGHTHRHPILAGLDDDDARAEISAGKTWLETTLGEPITLFAYPNGKPGSDYLPEQARLVESLGFSAAVSTQAGFSTASTDPYQLRRFTPWGSSRSAYNLQLLKNLAGRQGQ
ncbi:MAG: polysaccharide deacetylase family protein [Thiobacillus sp.]